MKYISLKSKFTNDIFYYQIDEDNKKAWRILYNKNEPRNGWIWENYDYFGIIFWINNPHSKYTSLGSLPSFVKPNHLAPPISTKQKMIRAF